MPSYEPIVGGGANGCVLHYRANNAELRDGDLLLVDAGAEYQCYASDITRTWPVNGRWSPEQRALYDLVLAAQLDAIDEVRVGRAFDAYHEAAVRTLTRGLCKLGLLAGSVEKNLREHAYRKFYMNRVRQRFRHDAAAASCEHHLHSRSLCRKPTAARLLPTLATLKSGVERLHYSSELHRCGWELRILRGNVPSLQFPTAGLQISSATVRFPNCNRTVRNRRCAVHN